MENLGASLRQARIAKNISLETVENETRIRKVYLQAMENEQWRVLPGEAYLRGFLRTYARYLGQDEEEYVEALNKIMVPWQVKEPVPEKIDLPGRPKRKNAFLFAVLAIIILFGSQYVYRNYFAPLPNNNTPPVQQNEPPAELLNPNDATPEPPEAPQEVTDIDLLIKVTANRCWMQIRSSGQVIYEGTLSAGQEIAYENLPNVSFRMGNSKDTQVYLNGVQLTAFTVDVVDKEYTVIDGAVVEVLE
ncbi:MAG: DUF4115 domain-containing protein [Clostridia bacterium]|jgi:hypothetical protein|nr:DUF4115 domain-containing protein [Clostridia bacterium]